jgi:hypothetical protein
VIDCVVPMVQRIRTGRSPFAADRGHFHPLLLDADWPTTAVALFITGASLAMAVSDAAGLVSLVKPAGLVNPLGRWRNALELSDLAVSPKSGRPSEYSHLIAGLRRYERAICCEIIEVNSSTKNGLIHEFMHLKQGWLRRSSMRNAHLLQRISD